jgi:hypothetical protein
MLGWSQHVLSRADAWIRRRLPGSLSRSPFGLIAAWNEAGWQPLGSGLASWTEDAGVAALLPHDGDLYVGGVFFRAGADTSVCIARWED